MTRRRPPAIYLWSKRHSSIILTSIELIDHVMEQYLYGTTKTNLLLFDLARLHGCINNVCNLSYYYHWNMSLLLRCLNCITRRPKRVMLYLNCLIIFLCVARAHTCNFTTSIGRNVLFSFQLKEFFFQPTFPFQLKDFPFQLQDFPFQHQDFPFQIQDFLFRSGISFSAPGFSFSAPGVFFSEHLLVTKVISLLLSLFFM